jgi:hypothetical protein
METVFLNENSRVAEIDTRVEAGSNTSTVTLQVVEATKREVSNLS